jgi:lysophospholipase L1-like esterase
MIMSVQSQIDRIEQNVANTYSTLEEAGATMPQTRNTDNLSETAASIKAVLYGKAQSLTEAQKTQARENIGAVSADETPKVFYITMNTDMTVDKTDAEIETAYQAGKSLVCRLLYDSPGFLQYINCPLSIRLELDGQVVGWVFSMAGLMPGTTNPSAGYFIVAGGKVENFDIRYSTTQDDIPTELPNPYALTFRDSNNNLIGTYDGSTSLLVKIPSKTPNPYALTINGTTYDGSKAVNITLEGGSGTDLSKGYTLTDSDLLHAWWVSTSTDTPLDMTNDMFCTRKFETTIVPRITFDSSYTNCANYTFWKDGVVVGEVQYATLKETYTVDFEFDAVSMNFGWGWGATAKQYNIVLTIPSSDEMAFKKVLVLGDSISADYYGSYTKWVTMLKDDGIFPANTVNDSIHATGFVARYTGEDANAKNDFITRIAAVDNKKSYDLVVVFGGINDYIQHIPMGESGGDKTANFKPAVDYFFDYLVKNFTQARIVVFSPLRTYNVYKNTAGFYQTEYTDYIKSVAKSYCLPVLNLTEESGFCPFVEKFKNKWTLVPSGYTSADGVHPNEEYQKRFLAPMIKRFLLNYVTGYGAMETEGYTNLVSTMESLDSTAPYNGVGYKNGVYISSSAPYEGTDAACVSTGLMPYGTGVTTPIYIKGVTIDTSKSHCRIHGFSADKTLTIMAATGSALNTYFTIETLGDQYYKVTPTASWTGVSGGYADYLRFSLIGTGENLIITLDEPIE